MYRIYIDDELFYSPNMAESYGLQSAVLTSKANMADTLKIVIPPTHPLYNLPQLPTSEVVVFQNSTCIFAGHVYSITRDFRNMKTIYVESLLGILNNFVTHGTESMFPRDASGNIMGSVFKSVSFAGVSAEEVANEAARIIDTPYKAAYDTPINYYFVVASVNMPTGSSETVGYLGFGAPKSAMEYIQYVLQNVNPNFYMFCRYEGFDYLLQQDTITARETVEDDDGEIIDSGDTPVSSGDGNEEIIEEDEDVYEYNQTHYELPGTSKWRRTVTYGDGSTAQNKEFRQIVIMFADKTTVSNNGAAQTVEFGVNLVDLNETYSAEGVFTALHPTAPAGYYDSETGNVEAYEDTIMTLHDYHNASYADTTRGNYVRSQQAIAEFGYITKQVEYPDLVETSGQLYHLLADDDSQATRNTSLTRKLTIRAIDSSILDSTKKPLRVGTSVRILSTPHNLDEIVVCQSATVDLLDPTKSTYSFGELNETVTAKSAKDALKIVRKTDQLA